MSLSSVLFVSKRLTQTSPPNLLILNHLVLIKPARGRDGGKRTGAIKSLVSVHTLLVLLFFFFKEKRKNKN